MIGRIAIRRGKLAAGIQRAAKHRQRLHRIVHPQAHRRPIAPVPFCDVIGREVIGFHRQDAREITAHIQRLAGYRQRVGRPSRHAAETANPGPIGAVPLGNGDRVKKIGANENVLTGRIQSLSGNGQRIHLSVRGAAHGQPIGAIPSGDTHSRVAARCGERAASIQILTLRQRPDRPVHTQSERRPLTAVPLRNVAGRVPAGRCKLAAYIQRSALQNHRPDCAVQPRSERRPLAAVPACNPVGHHVADDGETAADVEVARAVHRHRVNARVCARQASHADPICITERWVNPHRICRLRIIDHYRHGGPGAGPHLEVRRQIPAPGITGAHSAIGQLSAGLRQPQLRSIRRRFR